MVRWAQQRAVECLWGVLVLLLGSRNTAWRRQDHPWLEKHLPKSRAEAVLVPFRSSLHSRQSSGELVYLVEAEVSLIWRDPLSNSASIIPHTLCRRFSLGTDVQEVAHKPLDAPSCHRLYIQYGTAQSPSRPQFYSVSEMFAGRSRQPSAIARLLIRMLLTKPRVRRSSQGSNDGSRGSRPTETWLLFRPQY